MGEKERVKGMLSPYRVLDLTDEKGLLCGKLLGDLGADVIKIERPGGDPARNIGPFYHDDPDPDKSLFWFAFNTSKRGITLDIEKPDGQEVFRELVRSADFVIESFQPGHLDKLGLGYSALEQINPQIILVSITPFGQTGPYKDYKAPDIIAWAMGGQMYVSGDSDRPPVRTSDYSQAYLHAGAEAAVGALTALYDREMTGEGQQVDVSIQESVTRASHQLTTIPWEANRTITPRGVRVRGNARITNLWPCKDGYVIWLWWGGPIAERANTPLLQWMESEGMLDDFLKKFDWITYDFRTVTQEVVDRIEEPTRKFFLTHTKTELFEEALNRNCMLYPMATTKDIVESTQLAARRYWVELEHPQLGTTITYPGTFANTSEAPPRVSRRAPLIGEHNRDIYEKELDLSGKELLTLRQAESYQSSNKESKRGHPLRQPLEGIKVIDFTWAGVGPITAKALSDYGAEVVRLEGRSKPEFMRAGGPFKDNMPGLDRSSSFNQWNTGKLSVAINLAKPRGVRIAKKFVGWADIVVESMAGGAMRRMGLGYEELKKVKPEIIMLSTCTMGQTGPYATLRGYGGPLTALSGFNHITGWPDREPAWIGAYTDFIAPRFNALAILAALDYRNRTGKGQYLDLSQYENATYFMSPLILDYLVNRRVANRVGNGSPYAAPHGAYRCRGEDRWCVIATFTEAEWQSFCKVIGNVAWTSNPKFAALSVRKENEDELDKLVEAWTINYSAEEVMSMMQTAGVPAGVVQTAEDLQEHDPQLKHRHLYWSLHHPEVGEYVAPRTVCPLSKCQFALQRAPLLGEHNEYALKEIIGMSDEEISDLVIEGVIE